MKRVVLISVALVMVASMAFAQAGIIGVYQNSNGTDCDLSMPAFALVNTYIVHMLSESSASQWKLDDPNGIVLASAAEPGILALGTITTGISVSYGGCVVSPISLFKLTHFNNLDVPDCSPLTIIPDPLVDSGQIEVIDCALNTIFGTGFTSYANGNTGCMCVEPTGTEDATWGQIKALYR